MKKLFSAVIIGLAALSIMPFMKEQTQAKDADGDIVIVIDAGHGEADPGSIGATTGVYEKDCNLAIAKAMKEELCKYDGVKVYLTRSGDEWMTNTGRAMIAASLNADFLISIHNNSGSDTSTGCIAYRSLNEFYSEATNDMCSLITENLAALGLNNGGVQTRTSTSYDYEDYYTLIAEGVRAGIPSIIVEHCFLSNPSDETLLCNSDGTVNSDMAKSMGQADAKAVVTYYNLSPRTEEADSETSITLQKGYSVKLTIPGYSGDEASWYSIDKNVASVDENGVATTVGAGTTNIVYKLPDETSGYCTIIVESETAKTVTGGVDPTFYDTPEELENIVKDDVFAFVTYSDGSSKKVKPDKIGSIDYEAVGIQDIDIEYGELKGALRVCMSMNYIPEVTLPEPTQPQTTEPETEIESNEGTDSTQNDDKSDNGPTFKNLIKYIIVLLVVVIIGIVLVIVENKRRRRRRRRRRR